MRGVQHFKGIECGVCCTHLNQGLQIAHMTIKKSPSDTIDFVFVIAFYVPAEHCNFVQLLLPFAHYAYAALPVGVQWELIIRLSEY